MEIRTLYRNGVLCTSVFSASYCKYHRPVSPDNPGCHNYSRDNYRTGGQRLYPSSGLKERILRALVGGGLFFIIAVVSRGGMGGGDIKLIAMIGSFLGFTDVLITI